MFKVGFAAALVTASVAMPFVAHYRLRAKSRDVEETLRRQGDELNRLTAENFHLSNSFAAVDARSLSTDQFQELLRLRGEVARLRAQTNALGELRAENRRLEAGTSGPAKPRVPMSPAEISQTLATEILDAMRNVSAALPAAIQAYTADHNGEPPKTFTGLRKYFPTSGGRPMTGLYTFEFIRDEGPQPADALILRESAMHTTGTGQYARFYAFTDGTILEVSVPNDDFNAWEREHMNGPPPGR